MSINDTREQIDRCFTPINNDNRQPAIGTPEYFQLKSNADSVVHELSKDIERAIAAALPQDRDAIRAYRDSLREARQDLNHGLVLAINEQWKAKQISDNKKDADPEPIAKPTAYLDKYHAEQERKRREGR